jgi:hypothetical protein
MKRNWLAGIFLALALAGCDGAERPVTIVPYKSSFWSPIDQGTFVETCDASRSDVYCICALGEMIDVYPDPQSAPGSVGAAGAFAAKRTGSFRGCSLGPSRGPTDAEDSLDSGD